MFPPQLGYAATRVPTRVLGLLAQPTWLACIGAACAFVTFVGVGVVCMRFFQPAEDAYILYRYAENVAHGHGIVFSTQGPRAEGATDFLWMILLAGGAALGSDVVSVALVLNGLGAALSAFVLVRAAGSRASDMQRLCAAGIVVLLVTGFHGALAAYRGFSTLFFGGLALSLSVLELDPSPSLRRLSPYLALLLALSRPEGALLAAGALVIELFDASDRDQRRALLVRWAPAIGLGCAYLVFRAWYFRQWLPLPLYVKSRPTPPDGAAARFPFATLLPSLHSLWAWFGRSYAWLLSLLGAVALFQARRFGFREQRLLVAVAPIGLLMFALVCAHQTQNINDRFETPGFLALSLLVSCAIMRPAYAPLRRWALLTAMGLCGLLVVRKTLHDLRYAVREADSFECYVGRFAPRAGRLLEPGTRVALTEAGRLPYWSGAQVLDVLGLNSPETATRPVSLALLRDFRPDVVMFHQAGTLELSAPVPRRTRMRELSGEQLKQAVRRFGRRHFEAPPASFRALDVSSEQLAALVLARYLVNESERFRIYAVQYCDGGRFLHVYGIRKTFPQAGALAAELARSMSEGAAHSYGYYTARSLRGASCADLPCAR